MQLVLALHFSLAAVTLIKLDFIAEIEVTGFWVRTNRGHGHTALMWLVMRASDQSNTEIVVVPNAGEQLDFQDE